ncbi:putative protein OS=Tsukamurella paurometabola (strain ATCC 8368 / DSM / CCUG 35730 /CIP 100753 / JCM 10117 / KCTC 9821 / NBRC 16120 / NCIMB 702349/ NCTC 13040) OX=521096 GN=Tpau_3974 PE=4 SV=1 [Tsukamurella paurometabola]|uniref:Uncharacterized protein n=1 Tax=Tsukamurella paurometabola (strain ATCC 8368 / DSM 20162 / CCUG 35730 / CIP 100753 / JCM 10117 / KCTC 9821 / NBRC 16120 / NCIMB 702349 / NCTC 13040) TaxID=521096 RepID=D5UMS1_TSUPD|nr:hypothetical protein [Tsukamurella paurometabola]ADG80545.1 hypothetical protein Tpau_3974 [Tsukamurella paurometabola DSM 20162]SUP40041.1 Uncharacterised protein [Tsukamurella paurometabola]
MSSRSTIRRTVAGGLAALGVMSASFVASTGTAGALEPCPPGQTPFWNGKNCVMQLCNPPYNPTFPPCTMPMPTAPPAAAPGAPGSIPGQPF